MQTLNLLAIILNHLSTMWGDRFGICNFMDKVLFYGHVLVLHWTLVLPYCHSRYLLNMTIDSLLFSGTEGQYMPRQCPLHF